MLLTLDEGFQHHCDGIVNVPAVHVVSQLNPGVGFGQTNQAVHVPRRHWSSPCAEGFCSQFGVEGRKLLRVHVGHLGEDPLPCVDDVLLQHVLTDGVQVRGFVGFGLLGLLFRIGVRMAPDVAAHHVAGQHLVLKWIRLVSQDAHQVKATQNGIRQIHVLREGPLLIISSLNGIRHSYHGAASLQRCHDPSLGDGDGLLLHGFVQ
mmetsp:Transcript_9472/g.19740  ORF Transcript_9472/g.19740 Transcript_9472/m.19740 type:complete len:205 (+) Transcript_9472:456-1070(+)